MAKGQRKAIRPTWEGHLRLSLVTCPVALYTATERSADVHFHLINPKTNHPVATIHVGSEPDGIAAAGGRIFVGNQLSGTVSVINAGSIHVVKTISLGLASPSFMASF